MQGASELDAYNMFIIYSIKIVIYFVLFYCVHKTAKTHRNKNKFPGYAIIGYAILFGIYAILVGNPVPTSDRYNYGIRFMDPGWNISSESIGLNFLYDVLRPISLNPDFLFFSVEAIYVAIALLAYRCYKGARSESLLFLFSSTFPIFGFMGLKQAVSQGIITVVMALYFSLAQERNIAYKFFLDLLMLVLMISAILFHETSLVVPLILFFTAFWKYKLVRFVGYIAMVSGLLAFGYILNTFLLQVGDISEELASQTEHYQNSDDGFTGSVLTIVKGVPFYIISFIAIRNRRKYVHIIDNYDKYLFLSLFISCAVAASAYNYWMFRFAFFFYLPVFVFASELRFAMYQSGLSIKWYHWSYVIMLLLSIKELSQYYFLYGGV